MSRRTHALLLWCAATDKTFARVDLRGTPALAGKCIHCNTTLCIALDGAPISRATVEHIVPRTHGGTDAIENLAIACARCNGAKGVRHDPRPWSDPGLQHVVSLLQARRRERAREPLAGLRLPPILVLTAPTDPQPGERTLRGNDPSPGAGSASGRGRGRRRRG